MPIHGISISSSPPIKSYCECVTAAAMDLERADASAHRNRRERNYRSSSNRILGWVLLLLGVVGVISGVGLQIAYHTSPKQHGSEARCKIELAAKSAKCMQYVVKVDSTMENGSGIVNGDGRIVKNGIMVIPIDKPQVKNMSWDDTDNPQRGWIVTSGVENGSKAITVSCYVYTTEICPLQLGYMPHQLNEGCCPRNDAYEGGAQSTWIYSEILFVRSGRRWFAPLGVALIVLGMLLTCIGNLVRIGFGFAYVMKMLEFETGPNLSKSRKRPRDQKE